MQHQNLTPVAIQERIQAIDIIRGFALLGVVIVNFTVDDNNTSPQEGWTGVGDQLVYWAIAFFMDDKFQSIYCFLFGLGFTIQMQRASARKSFFGFAFVRRMIGLYFIGAAISIIVGEAYDILPYYAMVGLLLLLFWKLPLKLLPVLAIIFFLLPWARNLIIRINLESKKTAMIKKSDAVDTAVLDKYVGVYEVNPEMSVVIMREGTALYGQGPFNKIRLYAITETEFQLENRMLTQTFVKDSAGRIQKYIIQENAREISTAKRTGADVKGTLKKLSEQRSLQNSGKENKPSFAEFIRNNVTDFWEGKIRSWSWNDFIDNFLWNRNYKIGHILVLFLLGMYWGRRKMFQQVSENYRFLENTWKWGIIIGSAFAVTSLGFNAWNFANDFKYDSYPIALRLLMERLWDTSVIAMALAYIAGFILLFNSATLRAAKWQGQLSFFSTVGRMGLTNYLLHLVAFLLIFKHVKGFLGLAGRIGCLYRLLFAIAVYILLYFFSHWWFKYFRIGPFEWLWRSLTYLKFQPLPLKSSDHG
jgi:uncharacterized protein